MNAQAQTTTADAAPIQPQIAVLPPPPAVPVQSGAESPGTPPNPIRKLTRNGKIARLPKHERDMVNRMLQNNIPHPKIRGALEEHDIYVTDRNISNWKTRGGYQEWCAEQERALNQRLHQDNLTAHLRTAGASQLPEVGLQAAATDLSQFLLTPEARQQLASDPQKYARTVAILCRLAGQIHALQKDRDDSAAKVLGYDEHPERVRRKDERKVEVTRSIYSAEDIGKGPNDPIIHHRNFIPKDTERGTMYV